MKIVTFDPLPGRNVRLTGYLHEQLEDQPGRDKRPCVLVCPGGAYRFLSPREADPIAFQFFTRGYQVFLLFYSVSGEAYPAGPALHFNPLMDASRAMMLIRDHSEEYHIDPNKIAVCGFSAGGHLAASLAILWNTPQLKEHMDTENGKNRPNAAILCYPVISSGEFAHRESLRNLTGDDPEELRYFSLENQITSDVPPVFLWHTVTDDAVPVENSLMLASALRRQNIPMECHFYGEGPHGISLANKETSAGNFLYNHPHEATWMPLCIDWLDRLFGFEK